MFKKKKFDPIEEGILKTTFTLEEIRENYVHRKHHRRLAFQLTLTEIFGTLCILIALCIGYAVGVSSGVAGTEIARQSNAAIEEAVSEEVAENLGDK